MSKSAAYIIDNFPKALNQYMAEWRQLEAEYYKIPSWRHFKQMRNIKQREQLTRLFATKMQKWGLIP
jgi:hypothetical protein